MAETSNTEVIRSLQKEWNKQVVLAYLLFAAAISLFAAAVLLLLFNAQWQLILFVVILVLLAMYMFFWKKIREEDVVRFLNEAYPGLQESVHLVLKPYESLNALEKLQVRTIERHLQQHFPAPLSLKKKMLAAVIAVVMAVAFTVLLNTIVPHTNSRLAVAPVNTSGAEAKPALVDKANITITPPAYTAKRLREQDGFNITAEQGAGVLWQITTTTAVADVQLVFNDKSILHLQPSGTTHTAWQGRKQVNSAGFYQVKIAAGVSPL